MKHKPNHIEEYFKDENRDHKKYELLFNVSDDNVDLDLKTEVSEEELRNITTLEVTNDYLEKQGIKRVFSSYIEKFLRLKISLERKSREEFVRVNQPEQLKEQGIMQNMQQMMGIRK